MNQSGIAADRNALEQFHYWLKNGLYTGLMIFTLIFLPLIVVLLITGLAVIVLSVYMIRTLVLMGKKGWIIGFAVSMIFPLLMALVLSESQIAANAGWFIPICMCYLFCFILRYSVGEWINDLGEEKPDKSKIKQENEIREIMEKSRKNSF